MYRIKWASNEMHACPITFSYEFLLKVSGSSIQRGKQDNDTSAEISVPAVAQATRFRVFYILQYVRFAWLKLDVIKMQHLLIN